MRYFTRRYYIAQANAINAAAKGTKGAHIKCHRTRIGVEQGQLQLEELCLLWPKFALLIIFNKIFYSGTSGHPENPAQKEKNLPKNKRKGQDRKNVEK